MPFKVLHLNMLRDRFVQLFKYLLKNQVALVMGGQGFYAEKMIQLVQLVMLWH